MTQNKKKIIYIFFIILITFSLLYILNYYCNIYFSKKENNLLNEISINENVILLQSENEISEEKTDIPITTMQDTPQKTERMLQVEELQKENSEIKAWIEIENTNINYPVLQSSNNSYYMNHNYKKQWSKSGSIFLDKDYTFNPPSSNLLIYGHNLKNGTMFETLLKYKNKNFYTEHPTIRFTTNEDDSYYEIISVFESRVYYKSEQNVFRYYYFVNAENEDEYNNFVINAKNASLYDTGKTAQYGDQLMTLSTCSYHTKDGRFAVIAKKIYQ